MKIFTKDEQCFVRFDLWNLRTRCCIMNFVELQNLVRRTVMSDEVLDDVMIKGTCKGKAEAIVNCQCNIESAPSRCEQAEHCMFYSYYKCSKQWKRLA